MIKNFKPRLYQETILATTALNNTLVVLPTGMGKTAIALLLAAQRLKNHPNSKIIILAPTRPLVEQHLKTFQKYLEIDKDKMVLFTGLVKPEKRHQMFKDSQIIFSTPQGLENDIISNKISVKDVSLMVFDECHRASGDYSYVWIASQYYKKAQYPKILGLTASPGDDLEKIQEVCQHLFIEKIEIRTEKDPDVKPYIQEVKLRFIKVNLPEEFKEVKQWLEKCFKSKLKEVRSLGIIPNIDIDSYSKKELLGLQAQLHGQLAQGIKDFDSMKAVSLLAQAMKTQHALELIETQGIFALHHYLSKLVSDSKTTKVKATINLVKDINFRMAWIKTETLMDNKAKHPKLLKLKEIIKDKIDNHPEQKFIIFTQYRDSAVMIRDELDSLSGAHSKIFVGQAKKANTGISQKEQIKMLKAFSQNGFNILIATSVAEEGIDIPKVDSVIFYEPIPSAIRHIQRRGRTGRTEKGEIIILTTLNTRDEGYRWSAYYKERRMLSTLEKLKQGFELKKPEKVRQKTIRESITNNYIANNSAIRQLHIITDYREKGSPVIKELIEQDIHIELKQLAAGDFIIPPGVGIEYKTTVDFVNSIVDGRLLEQIKHLKQSYEKPIIVIEGIEDIYAIRNIHPNAIRGMLTTIAISYGIPIIQTKTSKDTAQLFTIIARNEQVMGIPDYYTPHSLKPKSAKEQQEFIVSALPNIGLSLAKSMLKKFKTVKNVINASKDKLKEVEQLGELKADKVTEILNKKYSEDT